MNHPLTADTLVKMLNPDRMPAHGGSGQWPAPGVWRSVALPLVACEHGLHVCTIEQAVMSWPAPEMWLVEVGGEQIAFDDKLVVERARLLRRIDNWNDRNLRLFAADCAERVLPLYERQPLANRAPRDAIAVARRYAVGDATDSEAAATNAAAAWDAAWDAAEAATWAAAEAGIHAAARAAAWGVTWDAERQWQSMRLLAYLNGAVES